MGLPAQHVYPQSNGKAEATVKSMKTLIQAAWTGSQVDEGRLTRSLLQYRNTPSGIICHQLRNYLADQSRTLFQLTIEHLLRNGNRTQTRLTSRLTVSLIMWSSTTTDMPFLYRTSILAQMWPFKILSRNVGIFMESSRRSVLTAIIASRLPVGAF